MKRTPKLLKARLQAPAPEQCWEVAWVGSQVSERLRFRGLGPFIAAGPIMAALAGAGVGGVVGGLTGALIGMGIPEDEAKRYEGRVKNGGILISIHANTTQEVKEAKQILEETGAQDISSTSEASS